MNLSAVHKSLEKIESNLQQVIERRERLLKTSRDVILSCSRGIVLMHSKKKVEARKEVQRAEGLLKEMRKDARGGLARYLISPETEFVEASVIEAVLSKRAIPDSTRLGVSDEAYLLGLLDSVGELKRLILVSITQGDAKRTNEYFSMIEQLYAILSPFAVFDNVVNGVRRKIDVARMVAEDTRGIIAEEARREVLLSSIERLERRLK